MTWLPLWHRLFRDEPSANAIQALDEMARLGGVDDPMMIIAMFLHRHNNVFEQDGAAFRLHAGELERAAATLRDYSQDLATSTLTVTKATTFVTNHVGKATAEVGGLAQQVSRLIRQTQASEDALHAACEAMRSEHFWWRPDLKLGTVLVGLVIAVAFLTLTIFVYRSPSMTIPYAAEFLVGADAAPALIELQRNGDLQAILECRGQGWHKVVDYCQPGTDPAEIRGWNTAPQPELPEKPAPFTAQ